MYLRPRRAIHARGGEMPHLRKRRRYERKEEEDPMEELFRAAGIAEFVPRLPKGFRTVEEYLTNKLYGEDEYKYIDGRIGHNIVGGRETLQPGGFDGKPYGYNGYTLFDRIKLGYGRNELEGLTCTLRSLDLRISILQIWPYAGVDTADGFTQVRIIIATDSKAVFPGYNNNDFANLRDDTTIPVASDSLMESGDGPWSYYRIENLSSRYRVLYDKIHDVESSNNQSEFNIMYGANPINSQLTTTRHADENLYEFACQMGHEIYADDKTVAGKINIDFTTAGTLDGTGPGINVLDAVTVNTPLTTSDLNFGKLFIQPGHTAGGETVQDTAEMQTLMANTRTTFKRDSTNLLIPIHIDLGELETKFSRYVVDGQEWGYFNDNALLIAFQTYSNTNGYANLLYANTRLTYWNN